MSFFHCYHAGTNCLRHDVDLSPMTQGYKKRSKYCGPLTFLGFELDNVSNKTSLSGIGLLGSKPILVVPADEEGMIHDLCLEYLD